MRTFITSIFVGLLLYNTIGYSVVYLLEEKDRATVLGAGFQEWYYGAENVVLKIPVTANHDEGTDGSNQLLPGFPGKEFIQIQSRQIIGDTLYLHCVFSLNARDQFYDIASKINDRLTDSSKSPFKDKHATVLKNFVKEYMLGGRKHVFHLLEWISPGHCPFASFKSSLLTASLSVPVPPPNLA